MVTKDEILNAVWHDTAVEENNLTVQVSFLRRALGDSAIAPQFVLTVPGTGYRFIGVVENRGATVKDAIRESAAPPDVKHRSNLEGNSRGWPENGLG